MRREVIHVMETNPELKRFCRQHPIWYRRLSRDPQQLAELQKEANYFFGRTFGQRVDRVQKNLGMIMMLIEMLRATRG
ncbi:YlbE-like family protein [Halalkalibacterium halodurans]|uniref:YlbE-like protein n=1 Tax=Halalkalibacterium halodurans TaxID=86665 RepID=A0A0M0KJP5_ALKHA|nr:YlbE-like family protein [Halalkalibacterium halodurans]MED3647880.1 YlbE-like family protein [Halalkalibacterium halodurans]MED4164806.1 YlbE-like family protein [Halalkalibacterium halodurans]TES55974.1 hypothetical protein E2L07_05895 [Halalkalibacterium halodurans]TPE69153.1 hypothetical protein AMD02_009685 [Halalkalibacterium halodurans]